MDKKKILCFITVQKDLRRIFYQYNKLFKELSGYFGKFYIIDLSNFVIFQKKTKKPLKYKKNLLPKNVEIISFKNTFDFYNFSKNKKLIAISNAISKSSPADFKIHYMLKKINAALIFINMNGRIGGNISFDFKLKNIFKVKLHFFLKGFYYLWRFLTVINIFNKIDILFTCSKDEIKIFNQGFSKKFEKITGLRVFLYRKIVRINNETISNIIENKNHNIKNKRNKYIVFADTPIDHLDRTTREGPVSKSILSKYYKNLFNHLDSLSKKINKKVLITLHPNKINNPSKEIKKLQKSKNFILSKKKTIEVIKDAEIFIYSVSSSITHAIVYNKRVICIQSKYLGSHFLEVINRYNRYLNFFNLNIDDKFNLPNNYNELMDESRKKYKKFINNRLTDGTNISCYRKIAKIIKQNYKIKL